MGPARSACSGPQKNSSPSANADRGFARTSNDFLSGAVIDRVLFDTKQSEEGGRFYHEQNRNVICLVNDKAPEVPPDSFMWLTLGQIKEFLRFNNYLNIQVRSLISALPYGGM